LASVASNQEACPLITEPAGIGKAWRASQRIAKNVNDRGILRILVFTQ
jgi:hypothetical protein